jgi:hypothetical protein
MNSTPAISARTGFWSDRGDGVDTLIPGDPALIRARAAELHHRSDRADEAGSGLREIELGAWTGAAARGFEDKYGGEPAKWFSASDSLAFAADALDSYADTLAWAQAQAGVAVQEWNRGQALTEQAVARYRALQASGVVVAPFTDPGRPVRDAAQATVDSARGQLVAAAADTAGTLRDQAENAPCKSSWLDDVGNFLLDAGAGAVNGLASFGNAMLHNPVNTAELIAGTVLMSAGAGGEVAGALLDATGIGAAAGIPLNISSAGVIAAGAGLTAVGAAGLAVHAIGDNRVSPMQNRADSSANERHGDGGRTSAKNQERIKDYQDQLTELEKNQGSRAAKKDLQQKIKNLRREGERAARGEEHSRGAKR